MNTKELLLQECLDFVEKKRSEAEKSIREVQTAANEDTKSSMGDKYETATEMLQQEKEKAAQQLSEAGKLKQVLDTINPSLSSKTAQIGSLVETSNGLFFISVGIGKIIIEGSEYFALSMASPLGEKLKGCKSGEEIHLNGRKFRINKVV